MHSLNRFTFLKVYSEICCETPENVLWTIVGKHWHTVALCPFAGWHLLYFIYLLLVLLALTLFVLMFWEGFLNTRFGTGLQEIRKSISGSLRQCFFNLSLEFWPILTHFDPWNDVNRTKLALACPLHIWYACFQNL